MTIRHSAGSYPVIFTSLRVALGELDPSARIVTDQHIWEAWGRELQRFEHVQVLEPGEERKSMASYAELVAWLAACGTRRNETVVAFGGGVIGDLVGFVAATYMRGIDLIQIPTTLLAMVDSSVGGKVGIDLPEGKNLLGSFKPPTALYICPETLSTLPERQFRNGMAEVLKYGFIGDARLVDELEQSPPNAASPQLESLVRKCIKMKQSVVERDEYETTGLRATLNFGHTVGHAIEKVQDYQGALHGEAISIGMVVESWLGERLGLTPSGITTRVRRALESQGLPVVLPDDTPDGALIEAMRMDKKRSGDRLAFSLLTGLGTCKLVTDVDVEQVRAALNDHR